MILKKLFLASVFCVLFSPVFAQQSALEPGWYILEPNAKYFVVKGIDNKRMRLKSGQCLMVFERDKGIYMCNDGFGRIIAISGENALTPIESTGRVGILVADAKAANGSTLRKGTLYWIDGVDEAAGKIIVKSAGGKTETLATGAVQPFATYLSSQQKGKDFKDSE